jgi:hypothetical protein
MAWDSSRRVPWKRLLIYLGIYAVAMIAIAAVSNPDRMAAAIPGLVIGLLLATAVMVSMVKLGWNLPILHSREEQAAMRAQRLAARAPAATATPSETAVAGPRHRPPPTRRTTTGPSQHPRRTNRTRKR